MLQVRPLAIVLALAVSFAHASFFDRSESRNSFANHVRAARQVNYATGSSRLGEYCIQNIDCIDYLMYCSSGICACTSSATQINDVCYKKIAPGDTSCSYSQQCDTYWPGTTCNTQSGQCECPTGYYVSQTRDGAVCVRTAAGGGGTNCPLPDLDFIMTTGTVNTENPQFYNAIQSPIGTQTACTIASGCNALTTTGTSLTTTTSDIYDCTASAGTQTQQTSLVGVCCPSRAYTCQQPPLNNNAAGTSTNPIQRYYYDSVAGACKSFSFYTDQGVADASQVNGNNFATLDHCTTYCIDTCERGYPQFTTTSTDPTGNTLVACDSTTSSCGTNFECDRVGSSYSCCGEPEFMCGYLGGRGGSGTTTSVYTTTPTVPDPGFNPLGGTATAQRWFFNTGTGTCEQFVFNYGGGNFNNFGSQNDCENYCYQELCTYGNPLKTTTGANQRCSSSSDCPTTYTCTSSSGATSIQICCPRYQTVCEQKKIIGTCTSWVRRYWHNPASGECEQFQYSGCGGNDNNFKLQIDCQTACQDTTAQPQCIQGLAYKDSYGKYYQCSGSTSVAGTSCPANHECYFDGFMWGCCPIKSYTCALSSSTGRVCGTTTTRWYYNSADQRCVSYTYNGCDGNSNNFASKYLCESYCGVGGCPNGGSSYRETTSNSVRTCSRTVTCPSGYECDSVVESGSVANRCCPTKAQICSTPPSQGQQCGSVNTERYYFNSVTKDCQTFTYQGCESQGNNFGTFAQCKNYCNSAACAAGEVVFLDPNTNNARSCSQALANSCPNGYQCRYDSLTQNSVCCGATNEGVCTSNEKAFVEALTMSPRECIPSIAGSCPNLFQCRYNREKGKYYCCAPLDGSICPTGRAAYFDTQSTKPVSCQITTVTNTCSVNGYSCQSVVPNTFSGFCCSQQPLCPNGADYSKDTIGNAVTCTMGGVSLCRTGYSCQSNIPGATSGYCCLGTGGAENAGCPPGQFVYKTSDGQYPTCNPYSTPQGCVNTYTCQFSNTRQQYQCCGESPIAVIDTAQSLGCPASQIAFVDPATRSPRICSAISSTVCPTGYYCQYSTSGVIQCCGLRGVCPVGQLAYVGNNGQTQQCTPQAVGACPANYNCIVGTDGSNVCCTTGGTNPTQPTVCLAGQVRIIATGLCVNVAMPNMACQASEQCQGGSTCQGGVCRCPVGTQVIGNVCQQVQSQQIVGIGQPCTIGVSQCQGGSSCTGNVCACPAGLVNIQGTCQVAVTQAPQLTGYCPAGYITITDGGVPRTCSGNTFACQADSCMYSATQRQYYCCRRAIARASQREEVEEKKPEPKGVDGCPIGKPLMYEFGAEPTPIVCQLNKEGGNQCPEPYTCLPHTDKKETDGQCCSAVTSNKKTNERQVEVLEYKPQPSPAQDVECPRNRVKVTRQYADGTSRTTCELGCPPNQIMRNGECVDFTLRLRDSPIVDDVIDFVN